jgi:hypothetical protein
VISPENGPFPSGSTEVQVDALEVVAGAELLVDVEVARTDVTRVLCTAVEEELEVRRSTAPLLRLGIEVAPAALLET